MTAWRMDGEFKLIQMAVSIAVLGRTTLSTELGAKSGQTGRDMKESTKWGRSMDKESSGGLTGEYTQESSFRINYTTMALMSGQMDVSMWGNGVMLKSKGSESSVGLMGGFARENIITIRKKDLESLNDRMD